MYSCYKTIQNESSVSVAPTNTVLVASEQTGPSDFYSGQIVNNDGSQTLNFWVQTSWNGTRWSRSDWAGGQSVAPGQARPFAVDIAKYRYVRIVGIASGIGISATCSAQLGYQSGVGGNGRR